MTIYKLSKDNCTYCKQLSNFLQFSKMSKYKDQIVDIHKETDVEKYIELAQLAQEQGYSSLPILMNEDGIVLSTGFDPTKITSVLEKEFEGD